MFTRRATLGLAAGLAVSLTTGALAAEPPAKFEMKAFEMAKAAGKPILVEITAPWCPICKSQKLILGKLRDDPKFKDLVAFEIDFDTDKASVRGLGARSQSTLIVFKGGAEVGRSVGEAQAEWIEDLLEKAI